MKKVYAILLLILVLNYTFYQVGIYLNYWIDVEGYTAVFCENIDQPEMQCNGKCHLTKVLAETEDQKQDAQNPVKTSDNFLQVYLPSEVGDTDLSSGTEVNADEFYYQDHFQSEDYFSFFRPPKLSV